MVLYIEKLDKEWPKVVNFINAGGGDPLCLYIVQCTLHRAEGLYAECTAGLVAGVT